ncbi:MAG: sensor histidine kinase [Bacteroidota bacterium]
MEQTGTENISQIFLISALMMSALAIFVVVFVLVYQRKMISQQMQLKQMEAEHQRELLKASIQSQESERKRIAQDLHDEVGAALSAIKLQVGQVRKLAERQEAVEKLSETARDLIATTIQNVRRISHDLLPPTLERLGLASALRDLARRADTETGPRIHFLEAGRNRRLPIDMEMALYRAGQELLTNAIRHAASKQIELKVNWLEEKVLLEVVDDGIGMQPENTAKGLGMMNIKSRLLPFDGNMNILPPERSGTRIQIQMRYPSPGLSYPIE